LTFPCLGCTNFRRLPNFEENVVWAAPLVENFLNHPELFAQVKSHWPLVSLVSGIALDAQLHSFIVAPEGPDASTSHSQKKMAESPQGDAYPSARSCGESDILTAPWKCWASEAFGRDWQRASSQTEVSL
jgi:hypothetical protein